MIDEIKKSEAIYFKELNEKFSSFDESKSLEKPVKMKVDSNRHHNAIFCHSEWGPTFGDDIDIANNANTKMDSYFDLGDCYKYPQYEYGTDEARTFLAGSHNFQWMQLKSIKKNQFKDS